MSKIKLYYHGGSFNHGCEAIVRSTQKIINFPLDLFSTSSEEDYINEIDKICDIYSDEKKYIARNSLKYFLSAVEIKLTGKTRIYTKYSRKKLLNSINKGDICLSIGGDNYCYQGVEVLGDLNYLIKKRGAKTVLWGCSIDSNMFNENVINDLKRYDLITVRESLTKDGLNKYGIKNNVKLYSDPAFQLDKIDLPLPNNFIEKNTVGINVSPLIIDCEENKGVTFNNFTKLLDYIIENTDMNIALIPHVVKEDSDDRTVLGRLYEIYKETNRVCLIEDCNCMELKGYISRCRFFVGARTHATIAAYSTCVPTLVVGYSIKAKGIAKDIFGTFENYVLPVQSLHEEDDLVTNFKWLVLNEHNIINHLKKVMPKYMESSIKAADEIRRLLK